MAGYALLEAYPNLDQVKFWGRIDGLTKSYYVMLGLTFTKSYEFPHKTFFYSYPTHHAASPETLISKNCQICSSSTKGLPKSTMPCPLPETQFACLSTSKEKARGSRGNSLPLRKAREKSSPRLTTKTNN